MRRIGWGMIGCGAVTEVKNGPGLYKARDSRLVGITNRTLSKAHDWVGRHGHGRVYDSAEALLADPEIDIVYVATTPDCHAKFAAMCARADKHCYLEKPIATEYGDAVMLRDLFARRGKKIFVAHYRRAMPRFRILKEMLENGAVGQIRYVRLHRVLPRIDSAVWRIHPEVSGGGQFFEGDVHTIDLAGYFVGPLHDWQVYADNRSAGYPSEDIVALHMLGRDGIVVSGLWHYASYKQYDCCEIAGDSGCLRFPVFVTDGPACLETGDGIREIALPGEENVGTPMIQDIIDELLGRGSCNSTLETAMNAMEVCLAVNRALAESAGQSGSPDD